MEGLAHLDKTSSQKKQEDSSIAIPDYFLPLHREIEYDYESNTFWNRDTETFAYPRYQAATKNWFWLDGNNKSSLRVARKFTDSSIGEVFDSFHYVQLEEDLPPRGYTAYLRKTAKTKMEQPSAADTGFSVDNQSESSASRAGESAAEHTVTKDNVLSPKSESFPQTFRSATAVSLPPVKEPVFIQTTPTVASHSMSSSTSNSIVALPDNFNGSPSRFLSFWTSLTLYMQLNVEIFKDDITRIMFVLSRCKGGHSEPWALARQSSYLANKAWPTWDDFVVTFKKQFYPINLQMEANRSLHDLRMKQGQRLTEFEAIWDTLVFQAE